ncbi:hypothetical protein MN608_07394 [Microdochium nivale]|nr:hypothetical protein MN608_07394 [Microdochium nivale]
MELLEIPEEPEEVTTGPVGMLGPPWPLLEKELDALLLEEIAVGKIEPPEDSEDLEEMGPVGMIEPLLLAWELDALLLEELESAVANTEPLENPDEPGETTGLVEVDGPPLLD